MIDPKGNTIEITEVKNGYIVNPPDATEKDDVMVFESFTKLTIFLSDHFGVTIYENQSKEGEELILEGIPPKEEIYV